MKQKWSPSWKSSTQPRKQRKFRINAPPHVRHRFVSANLAPVVRNQYEKRSMPLRKGDEVEVMRGSFRKLKGIVDRVDVKKGRIFVENVKIKKVDGSEVMKALEPSNLRITKLVTDDKMRQKALERAPGRKKAKEAKPEKKKAPKKEEGAPEKPGKAEKKGGLKRQMEEGMPKKEHNPKKGTKDGL